MAEGHCDPILDGGCDGLGRKPKRNHYFHGKQLGVDDFVIEQRYVIQKIRRLGLHLVGSGVVTGLRIEAVKRGRTVVAITPGTAVDGCGNLLVLAKKREFRLERKIREGEYIYLAYREGGTDKIPRERGETCSDDCCFSRIEEDVTIELDTTLDPTVPVTICEAPKKGAVGVKKGRVLLGRYTRKGGIDYSNVTPLHTIGELSKRLCEIAQRYVRSLNGQTGDLAAVTSINEATPDENGHLTIREGNNVSIESEGHTLTISSTGSFYHSQLLVLDETEGCTIRHGFGRIPVVDIYRVVENEEAPAFEAVMKGEIQKMAHAIGMEFESYMNRIGAVLFPSHMENFNAEHPSMKKRVYNARSETSTVIALSRYNVTYFSPSVERLTTRPVAYVMGDLVILPKYRYRKIVGGEESMHVTVETDRDSVVITNSLSERITLLLVLNA